MTQTICNKVVVFQNRFLRINFLHLLAQHHLQRWVGDGLLAMCSDCHRQPCPESNGLPTDDERKPKKTKEKKENLPFHTDGPITDRLKSRRGSLWRSSFRPCCDLHWKETIESPSAVCSSRYFSRIGLLRNVVVRETDEPPRPSALKITNQFKSIDDSFSRLYLLSSYLLKCIQHKKDSWVIPFHYMI